MGGWWFFVDFLRLWIGVGRMLWIGVGIMFMVFVLILEVWEEEGEEEVFCVGEIWEIEGEEIGVWEVWGVWGVIGDKVEMFVLWEIVILGDGIGKMEGLMGVLEYGNIFLWNIIFLEVKILWLLRDKIL